MFEKIKGNFSYVITAAIGLLNFILLAIPYLASFASYDLGEWGGVQSNSVGISGYQVMRLWSFGFGGVMSALMQIFILILGIALLVYGVAGLLKVFGVADVLPEKLGGLETKKVGEYGLYAFISLNVLLLVFMIITTATNSESYNEMGFGGAAGIRFSAGIFITLVFSFGALLGLKYLEKKFPQGQTDRVTFSCEKCGKKAKAKDKFCNECGGKIIAIREQKEEDIEKEAMEEVAISIDDVIPKE